MKSNLTIVLTSLSLTLLFGNNANANPNSNSVLMMRYPMMYKNNNFIDNMPSLSKDNDMYCNNIHKSAVHNNKISMMLSNANQNSNMNICNSMTNLNNNCMNNMSNNMMFSNTNQNNNMNTYNSMMNKNNNCMSNMSNNMMLSNTNQNNNMNTYNSMMNLNNNCMNNMSNNMMLSNANQNNNMNTYNSMMNKNNNCMNNVPNNMMLSNTNQNNNMNTYNSMMNLNNNCMNNVPNNMMLSNTNQNNNMNKYNSIINLNNNFMNNMYMVFQNINKVNNMNSNNNVNIMCDQMINRIKELSYRINATINAESKKTDDETDNIINRENLNQQMTQEYITVINLCKRLIALTDTNAIKKLKDKDLVWLIDNLRDNYEKLFISAKENDGSVEHIGMFYKNKYEVITCLQKLQTKFNYYNNNTMNPDVKNQITNMQDIVTNLTNYFKIKFPIINMKVFDGLEEIISDIYELNLFKSNNEFIINKSKTMLEKIIDLKEKAKNEHDNNSEYNVLECYKSLMNLWRSFGNSNIIITEDIEMNNYIEKRIANLHKELFSFSNYALRNYPKEIKKYEDEKKKEKEKTEGKNKTIHKNNSMPNLKENIRYNQKIDCAEVLLDKINKIIYAKPEIEDETDNIINRESLNQQMTQEYITVINLCKRLIALTDTNAIKKLKDKDLVWLIDNLRDNYEELFISAKENDGSVKHIDMFYKYKCEVITCLQKLQIKFNYYNNNAMNPDVKNQITNMQNIVTELTDYFKIKFPIINMKVFDGLQEIITYIHELNISQRNYESIKKSFFILTKITNLKDKAKKEYDNNSEYNVLECYKALLDVWRAFGNKKKIVITEYSGMNNYITKRIAKLHKKLSSFYNYALENYGKGIIEQKLGC